MKPNLNGKAMLTPRRFREGGCRQEVSIGLACSKSRNKAMW